MENMKLFLVYIIKINKERHDFDKRKKRKKSRFALPQLIREK